MPMNRRLYPQDWHRISRTVRDHFDWTCQACQKPMRQPGEKFDTQKRTLTCAHLDHDPLNWTDARLTALCAPCHLRYDNAKLFVSAPSDDKLPGVAWEIPFIRLNELRLNAQYCQDIDQHEAVEGAESAGRCGTSSAEGAAV